MLTPYQIYDLQIFSLNSMGFLFTLLRVFLLLKCLILMKSNYLFFYFVVWDFGITCVITFVILDLSPIYLKDLYYLMFSTLREIYFYEEAKF